MNKYFEDELGLQTLDDLDIKTLKFIDVVRAYQLMEYDTKKISELMKIYGL